MKLPATSGGVSNLKTVILYIRRKRRGIKPELRNKSFGFADFALAKSLKHNRSLKTMEKLADSINWVKIEKILMSHYVIGTNNEGADAYPP